MIIPPQFLALGGAVAILAGFAGGWTVRDWKCDAAVAKSLTKAVKKQAKQQAKVEAAAVDYEQERAHVIDRTHEIRTIYRDVPVSADCEPPAAVGSVLDHALAAANARASGEPGPTVPETAAAADPVP